MAILSILLILSSDTYRVPVMIGLPRHRSKTGDGVGVEAPRRSPGR